MKKFASILIICLQLACGVFSTPEPTATPPPTSIFTLAPSEPIIATSTPEIQLGDLVELVVLEGFTVEVPFFYPYEIDNNIILIEDENNNFTMTIVGDSYDGKKPLTEIIKELLDALERRGARFERSEPKEIIIDGVQGISMEVFADIQEMRFQGLFYAVSPSPKFFLYGSAFSNIDTDNNLWKNEHEELVNTILSSIEFVDTEGSCTISNDDTYGYTKENPIKVGGGAYDGPSRERAYLDNLLGPNGEELSYERQSSLPTDTTILDVYIVTGSGINETLYIDMYNFEEPQAPVGFTCKGAFPLTTP
jgi:hypothetical protein